MPSLFGHAVVALSAAEICPLPLKTRRFRALSVLCAVLPDVDAVGFALGLPYDSFWGHRGFTHSLAFGILTALVAVRLAFPEEWRNPARRWRLLLFFALVTVSHPILDALTNGGRGVALFAPFDNRRFFFSYRPIHVSPLSVTGFFGMTGLRVLLSETVFLVLPCAMVVAPWRLLQKFRQGKGP